MRRVKPDPELYQRASAELALPVGELLAIEDSPNGIRAAKRAGLRCLAIPNPVTEPLGLREADWVVTSLAEVSLEVLLARWP